MCGHSQERCLNIISLSNQSEQKSQVMNGLVTNGLEPTGNAREFDINERIASFPTIYDKLWYGPLLVFHNIWN